ncbi:MAG: S9 family peptidase, partial [Bacteroidota bacterium]
MRKPFTLALTFLLVGATTFAQRAITLEDIWQDYTFYPNYVYGLDFRSDGQSFTRLEKNKVNQYDLRTGDLVRTVVDATALTELSDLDGYELTNNESRIVLHNNETSIYRHSFEANFYVYERESGAVTKVMHGGNKTRLAAVSPTGDQVAFVFGNNLHLQDLNTNNVTQITMDGKVNEIINGATDWVYEEEFGKDNGLFWSPDGQQIAFYRFDETAVKEFTMTNYNDEMYPEYVTFKYPKVGEDNSLVSIHIYDLASGETTKVAETSDEWEYFPRIKWTNEPGELCVFFMNRFQNKLELRLLNTRGDSRTVLQESSDYYIDIHDNLTFLQDSDQFIWTSEEDGWNHVYLYNTDGSLAKQLTSGEWEVTEFYGLDETNATIFYQAAKRNPWQREVYAQSIKKADQARLLAGETGVNSAEFSQTYDYFVLTHSSANQPTSYTVVDRGGKRIRVIEDNARLHTLQANFNTTPVEFFQFKTSEKVDLNGYMIKPPNFNPNSAYPVLMYVYGGPGSQTVKDSWGGQNYWWFQMLAQQGFIVVSVDNRGTGARGAEFKKMTYQQLGRYETIDQIEAAKYLARQRYVDARRIG